MTVSFTNGSYTEETQVTEFQHSTFSSGVVLYIYFLEGLQMFT